MSKIRRITIKPKKYRQVAGNSPGVIELDADALEPLITVFSYSESELISQEIKNSGELDAHLAKHQGLTHWVDIRGLGSMELFEYIGKRFNIHKLVLEDIAGTLQRPKLDEYDGYLFATSRMLYLNDNLEIENEQMSFILMPDILISFQENYQDCLHPVVTRLEGGKGNIRFAGSSYLMYTLMDVIIDNYFGLIYRLGDELDMIEELLYRKPDKSIMYKIQEIKRAMILIRRAAWPERDKINDMIRSDSPLITQDTKTFLKDIYDHCMQVVDLVESYKDVTTTLIDMNLSIISNRMNEIMKVLTIISSIFIPLTFIAGVYGMNFSYTDPETGKVLHHNMPELYAENGYLYTLLAMGLLAAIQVFYFYRKGWFK
ncbi:magnesium/cobalt transporter CorA [Hufsiella ginkgonis]|uniref:Magnesium transport protein CorA n=1 Tax=Hufsiella ginkgonis TaxID=2695274 RepID=A0A7K1XWY4_9SPHI|nr:magnesium/cobalt transporter CorA [Hufsiella ginkgonis]MXV15505.1 magnesium/cobalt transporter CorA [Hufsiella ginkgonis]